MTAGAADPAGAAAGPGRPYGRFPAGRPYGLRRRTVPAGAPWWRIDTDAPDAWTWGGFAEPRNRFDPASGAWRVRYAARSVAGAGRERYQATGRYIPADHAGHRLVRLEARRRLRVLDLRTEANLDALGVDDRVSTGREAEVWDACHRLADTTGAWWGDDLDGIVYRSRTTPASSANLAFFSTAPFRATSARLGDSTAELVELVLDHGFTVGFPF